MAMYLRSIFPHISRLAWRNMWIQSEGTVKMSSGEVHLKFGFGNAATPVHIFNAIEMDGENGFLQALTCFAKCLGVAQ